MDAAARAWRCARRIGVRIVMVELYRIEHFRRQYQARQTRDVMISPTSLFFSRPTSPPLTLSWPGRQLCRAMSDFKMPAIFDRSAHLPKPENHKNECGRCHKAAPPDESLKACQKCRTVRYCGRPWCARRSYSEDEWLVLMLGTARSWTGGNTSRCGASRLVPSTPLNLTSFSNMYLAQGALSSRSINMGEKGAKGQRSRPRRFRCWILWTFLILIRLDLRCTKASFLGRTNTTGMNDAG